MVVQVSHVHTLVSSIFSAHELAMNAIMVYMITTVTDDRESPSLHVTNIPYWTNSLTPF